LTTIGARWYQKVMKRVVGMAILVVLNRVYICRGGSLVLLAGKCRARLCVWIIALCLLYTYSLAMTTPIWGPLPLPKDTLVMFQPHTAIRFIGGIIGYHYACATCQMSRMAIGWFGWMVSAGELVASKVCSGVWGGSNLRISTGRFCLSFCTHSGTPPPLT
jgi:hypothetical protein